MLGLVYCFSDWLVSWIDLFIVVSLLPSVRHLSTSLFLVLFRFHLSFCSNLKNHKPHSILSNRYTNRYRSIKINSVCMIYPDLLHFDSTWYLCVCPRSLISATLWRSQDSQKTETARVCRNVRPRKTQAARVYRELRTQKNSGPLGVSKTQTPEKLRSPGWIENSVRSLKTQTLRVYRKVTPIYFT